LGKIRLRNCETYIDTGDSSYDSVGNLASLKSYTYDGNENLQSYVTKNIRI